MTTALHTPRPVGGWAELALVAWRRSWAFTGLYRRSTRSDMNASRSWTWQWIIVAWQAAATFLPRLVGTAASAGEIWTLGSASAAVRPVRRRPARWDGLVLAAVAAVLPLAVLVGVELAVLFTDTGLIPALVLLLAVLAGAVTVVAFSGRPEGTARLIRRAQGLGGSAVVVSSVVAGHRRSGDGTRLMRSLQDQWADRGVTAAVLFAGSDDLVGYYRDAVGGWKLDGDSPRRMIWTGGATP